MIREVFAVDIGEAFKLTEEVGIGERFGTLGGFISVLLPNVYVLAGILLFVLLIAGGYGIIMGAGSGDSGQVGKGQKALTAAIIGFVIVFASWWIIQVIEVVTGMKILELGV